MAHYISMVHDVILSEMQKGDLGLDSIESLKNVLDEYDIHIKTIEEQLDICKNDHINLRVEITNLIKENKELYLKLKNKSDNRVCDSNDFLDIEKSSVVENLTQQLALALEERQTLEGLWKMSLNEVQGLQERLQRYKSGTQLMMTQSKLSDAQKDYSEAINLLESKLSAVRLENDQLRARKKMLENQMEQVTTQMANLADKNISMNHLINTAKQHEQEWKSRYLMLEAKYIELDKDYQADKVKFNHVYEYEKVESCIKEKLESALRQRDELQSALERCHETKAELLRAAARDRARVEEAVKLVDGAMAAQNGALSKEAKSAEELQRIKVELNNLVEEAGLRVAQEVNAVRKNFENHMAAVKNQLCIVEQERNRKTVEAEQWQKECARLESLLSRGSTASGADRKDKQSERLCREMRLMETECLQMKMDNDTLRDNVSRTQDRCRRISREKLILKHELHSIEQHNEICQRELAASNERVDLLSSQLHETSLQLARLHGEVISQKENVFDSQARSASLFKALEIYNKLDSSYTQMNGKWKNEMNTLTQKFEAKIKKYKTKNKQLEKDTTK